MPYTAPTLGQAASALASRLNDSANVRWVLPELYCYIWEALRTWSAWTSHWRDRGTVTTVMNEAFYDLPTELPLLRGQTVTNWDLVTELQYALMEPAAPGGTWTGTDQFTLAQLTSAIQRRRDQFLRETGAVVTRSVTNYPAPPASGRVALDESILIVRRAAWRVTATQLLRPLARTDEWAANAYAIPWPSGANRPRAYSTTATPPLELQIIDPPQTAGDLDLLSINKGAAIDSAVEASLGIPDDWCWVVKFGALADLLQGDGLALDPARAAYCEMRWQQGVTQARNAPVVLAARINDVPCQIGAMTDADQYSPLWQLISGTPRKILLTGGNLIVLWPPPGATGGPWTVTLDVVRNAPMPQPPPPPAETLPPGETEIMQISADVYDTILDYAQHLALFKEGDGQLELAMALLERAARAAGVDLQLQQAQQPGRSPITKQQTQDLDGAAPDQLPATVVG